MLGSAIAVTALLWRGIVSRFKKKYRPTGAVKTLLNATAWVAGAYLLIRGGMYIYQAYKAKATGHMVLEAMKLATKGSKKRVLQGLVKKVLWHRFRKVGSIRVLFNAAARPSITGLGQ